MSSLITIKEKTMNYDQTRGFSIYEENERMKKIEPEDKKFLRMKILEKCLMTDLLTFELSPGHEETLIGINLTTE